VETILLLSANRYSFTDEKEGRKIEGCRISYLIDDFEDEKDRRGFTPMEISGPLEVYNEITRRGVEVPALFRAHFSQRMNRQSRKVVLTLVALEYLQAVDIASIFQSGPEGVVSVANAAD